MKRTLCYFAVFCLLPASGCEPTRNTPHQYEELKRLMEQGHEFSVAYSGDLPIRFEPFRLLVGARNYNTFECISDVLISSRLREALHRKVSQIEANKKDGQAIGLVIEFEFRQEDGAACGSETVCLDLESDMVGVWLREIGKQGSPYSIVAKPTTIMWKWKGQTVSVPLPQSESGSDQQSTE